MRWRPWPIITVVPRIAGAPVYLGRTDQPEAEELFIALALLPPGTDEGSRLRYEPLQYTLL